MLVFVTPTIAAGQVFLPMRDPRVNALTAAELDPYSRQRSKHTAVQIDAVCCPAWVQPADGLTIDGTAAMVPSAASPRIVSVTRSDRRCRWAIW